MKTITNTYTIQLGRCAETPGGLRVVQPGDAAKVASRGRWLRGVETFQVALLDARHRCLGLRVVSRGTLDASIVHPRDVFREAVRRNVAAVVCFHNHPSGDLSPSSDDMALTGRLSKAGDILGIQVLDHLIIDAADPANLWYSMRENNWPA